MSRHKQRHRAGQRYRGSKRIAVDAVIGTVSSALEVMNEHYAEEQVDDPFRERHVGPGAMLADSEKHAARSRLAPHEVRGNNENDHYRIAEGGVFLSHPHLDQRLPENE